MVKRPRLLTKKLQHQKKAGACTPAVSSDFPGSSSRDISLNSLFPSSKDRVMEAPALPGCLACLPGSHHPIFWKMTIPGPFQYAAILATSLHQKKPSLVVTRPPWPLLSQHFCASFKYLTIPGRHLHFRCVTKLVFLSNSSSCLLFIQRQRSGVLFTAQNKTCIHIIHCFAGHDVLA